jgi:hypothetical protein
MWKKRFDPSLVTQTDEKPKNPPFLSGRACKGAPKKIKKILDKGGRARAGAPQEFDIKNRNLVLSSPNKSAIIIIE